MIGGEAEATQIPARCSSFDGSLRRDPVLRACPAPGWQVGGGHSRHVPARGAIAAVGHNWPGGRPWGKGYGVDFSLSTEQRELTEAAAAFARRERDLRDAVASTIYSGTSEIQRVVLARMLGL